MEINVKVNVEFGERTLKVLEGLGKVYAVVQPKEEEKKAVKAVKEVQKAEVKPEKVEEVEVEEVDIEEPTEKSEVTFDELRAMFGEKNTKANQPKLKKLINDLGYVKLSQIPEKKYAEALELLEAI